MGGHSIRAVLGLALMVAGLAAFALGLLDVISVGTCGVENFTAAESCTDGIGLAIAGLMGGIPVFLVGAGIFAMRGRGDTRPGLPEAGRRVSANPVPFGAPQQPSREVSATSLPIAADPTVDPLVRLERLAELKKAGLLSEQEFELQKTRILRD